MRKPYSGSSVMGFHCKGKGRGYCLVADGNHLPPKYTISLAHQVAMGEWLHSDQFSGGQESNGFLRRRGFEVAGCACGGSVLNDAVAPEPVPLARGKQKTPSSHQGERCPACKVRVAELSGTRLRDLRAQPRIWMASRARLIRGNRDRLRSQGRGPDAGSASGIRRWHVRET